MTAPMQGLRVLEVASWLAAPSCAALMADMGADVIKVEPPSGDTYRRLYAAIMGPDFVHPTFEFDNRGKRGVVIDFEQSEGRELLLELAKDADIFVTNLTGSRLKRYGLEYDQIRAVSPQCIYSVLSAFGTKGPDAEREGFDQSAYWARSGAMSVSGDTTSAPSLCRGGYGDHTCAINLLAAILAALRVRDQSGESQYVEVTLQRTGIWTLAGDVTTTLYSRVQPQRHDIDHPNNPAWNYYKTADDRWLLLVMPMATSYWSAFSELMGYPEWAVDERFQSLNGLQKHGPEIIPQIREVIAGVNLLEWGEKLDAAGLIWAPVAELPEVVEDPSLRENGAFEVINHPRAGAIETIGAPMHIRGADITVRGPAPELGEHSREVFSELNLGEGRLDELFRRGIVK